MHSCILTLKRQDHLDPPVMKTLIHIAYMDKNCSPHFFKVLSVIEGIHVVAHLESRGVACRFEETFILQ